MMNNRIFGVFAISLSFCTPVLSQNYTLSGIRAKRVEVTSVLDSCESAKDALRFIGKYKTSVDSVVGRVLGHSSMLLSAARPESLLSNWAADVLLESAHQHDKRGEKADFSIVNVGGLRSSLPAGEITTGDIFEFSPFQNKLVIVSMKGVDVLELFRQFSVFGGEGVSHGVEIVYEKNMTLKSARLNGKKIKKSKTYRVATLDYLCEGNDNMRAFTKSFNVYNTDMLVRDIYMNKVMEAEAKGEMIGSRIEGRTVIKK